MRKVKCWTAKKLKKARAKRSLERAKKRGPIYGGYICISDDYELRPLKEEEVSELYKKAAEAILDLMLHPEGLPYEPKIALPVQGGDT